MPGKGRWCSRGKEACAAWAAGLRNPGQACSPKEGADSWQETRKVGQNWVGCSEQEDSALGGGMRLPPSPRGFVHQLVRDTTYPKHE